MKEYVIDCTFCTALIVPESNIANNVRKSPMFVFLDDDILNVPQLWWFEISNVLKNLIHKKIFDYTTALELIPKLSGLNIKTDKECGAEYAETILRLSIDFNLSSYNAAYLELAIRRRACICTLDESLINAAMCAGLKTTNGRQD
ncbi:twitching motility protein PilT [Spirochaetia bacterium]|nr:twitching motility protein PilT [Spirochaetia bacterium]